MIAVTGSSLFMWPLPCSAVHIRIVRVGLLVLVQCRPSAATLPNCRHSRHSAFLHVISTLWKLMFLFVRSIRHSQSVAAPSVHISDSTRRILEEVRIVLV